MEGPISGSNNDINVLDQSPLFTQQLQGRAPAVQFNVNGTQYNMGYYLADGIYPEWGTFVKTISSPLSLKHKCFASYQEGARKDVERAFGVLQKRWAIIRHPARLWDREELADIMYACIIMHNMIVEDERGIYGIPDDNTYEQGRFSPHLTGLEHGPVYGFTDVLDKNMEIRVLVPEKENGAMDTCDDNQAWAGGVSMWPVVKCKVLACNFVYMFFNLSTYRLDPVKSGNASATDHVTNRHYVLYWSAATVDVCYKLREKQLFADTRVVSVEEQVAIFLYALAKNASNETLQYEQMHLPVLLFSKLATSARASLRLRLLVLASLFIQYFLFVAALLRKRRIHHWFRALIWLAYQGCDAVVIYALATLFNIHKDEVAMDSAHIDMLWAPILLLHLGGQDGITAYSIQDNENWRRHLLISVSQFYHG
ncbi:hypothetical protein EJB05_27556, partial [Eragrostis curvula]